MSVVLAFLVAVIAVALGWLLRQGVLSKPWLETGAAPATGTRAGPGGSVEGVGLGLFLVVVGSLFALFGSAFVMRMDLEAWSRLALPPIVWANTAQLVLASLLLRLAAAAARRGDRPGFRRDAAVAALAMAGFLVGQILAWRQLAVAGDGLATGPAASFFHLLSGLHGLHVLGGVGALALILARGAGAAGRLAGNARLCVLYCDFLLVVWGGLLLLFLGWANRLVDLCRGALT